MRETMKAKARLTPVRGEDPPLFSRWEPLIEPPRNGIYRYWSHVAHGDGLWTLWVESLEPLGEVGQEMKGSYDVAVHFAFDDAPHQLLRSGSRVVLSVGRRKKAELEIL